MAFPIDPIYISEAEQILNLKFPLDFKEKMVIENGGAIQTGDDDWELIPFFDRADNKRMSRTCNHIVLETNKAREWQGFPQDAVAIATNGYGDYLVLIKSGEEQNKLDNGVYLWAHETSILTQIAENFNELIG